MSIINSQPLIGASGQGGYFLTKSLRFRSSASAYLNRTPASAGNRKTWTWSAWVKRGAIADAVLFSVGASSSSYFNLRLQDNSGVQEFSAVSENPSTDIALRTSQQFRDPSAWYHLVFVLDTTQATSSNRAKFYVNGSQVTAFSSATYPSQNADLLINNNQAHNIARRASASDLYFDGYMTEINFIDGQALTPSSFGETSTSTGVWIPKKYIGTYGTNGFYLPFTDVATTSGSNAGLGKDFSGNGNYWTTNNISVTSGSTYDSMKDVPTLTDTDTANYCVLNPLAKAFSQPTFSNANLQISAPSAWSGFIGTLGVTSGKWYWEVVNGNSDAYVGICGSNLPFGLENPQVESGNIVYYGGTGEKRVDGAMTSYGASYSTETIGVALDIDGGTVTFYKNNTSQGSISLSSSTLNGKTIFPFFVKYASTATANFGQRPFAYTPPTGFKALNTFNLPTPTIGATASTQANDYFNAVTYSGTSATQTVSGVNFQPDFVWIKNRSNGLGFNHVLQDAVRGFTTGKKLASNQTTAEGGTNLTDDFGYVSSANSDGFVLSKSGAGSYDWYQTNATSDTYVAWNWKANGSGSTNTAGSITSTVSANTTAGFSIVTYTGNATSGATVGHGLGVAPSMVIVKSRSNGTTNWCVYHISVGNQYATLLNTTAASYSNSNYWNNTSPTSSVFSLGNGTDTNQSTGTYVAYCFAQVAGYSAFGSYTGNGSTDGPFIYTGFRPRYVLIRRTDSGANWYQFDTARETYNVIKYELIPNSSNPQEDNSRWIDCLSNGFKIRNDNVSQINASGGTFIYMAFAENPFKYSLAR